MFVFFLIVRLVFFMFVVLQLYMLSVQNENCVGMYLNQHCCNSCVLFEMPLFPSLFFQTCYFEFPCASLCLSLLQ